MSRRNKTTATQPSTSKRSVPNEPSTSKRASRPISSSSDDSEEEDSVNQRTPKASGLKENELETMSNNLVKYFLNFSDLKVPVKRLIVAKSLNIPTKHFLEVLAVCKKKMFDVYGLEVAEVEHGNAKVFIVYPDKNYFVVPEQIPEHQRQEQVLLFIILSYIFMKGGAVQDSELYLRLTYLHPLT